MTQIVVGISDIVRLDFACDLEQDSFSYNRFITHLRYLAQRIVSGVSGGKNDAFLYEQVKVNYPKSFTPEGKIFELPKPKNFAGICLLYCVQ